MWDRLKWKNMPKTSTQHERDKIRKKKKKKSYKTKKLTVLQRELWCQQQNGQTLFLLMTKNPKIDKKKRKTNLIGKIREIRTRAHGSNNYPVITERFYRFNYLDFSRYSQRTVEESEARWALKSIQSVNSFVVCFRRCNCIWRNYNIIFFHQIRIVLTFL